MAACLLAPRVGHPVDPLCGCSPFVARTTVNFVPEMHPVSSQPVSDMWSAHLMELEEDVPRSAEDTLLDLLAEALGSLPCIVLKSGKARRRGVYTSRCHASSVCDGAPPVPPASVGNIGVTMSAATCGEPFVLHPRYPVQRPRRRHNFTASLSVPMDDHFVQRRAAVNAWTAALPELRAPASSGCPDSYWNFAKLCERGDHCARTSASASTRFLKRNRRRGVAQARHFPHAPQKCSACRSLSS